MVVRADRSVVVLTSMSLFLVLISVRFCSAAQCQATKNGHCMVAQTCPEGKIYSSDNAGENLCDEHLHICCLAPALKDSPCKEKGGECIASCPSPARWQTTQCPSGTTCCVWLT